MTLEFASIWTRDSRAAPVMIFLLALLFFCINLDRPPHPDELHHVLAAERLLETGRPLIGEGEYRRGILHTWMVAVSYEIFGDGLASARLPAALLVALAAAVLFLWVRREAGAIPAWITTSLFVLSPFSVEIAQFSRFYALQIVFFLLGSICVFYLLAPAVSFARRTLLAGLGATLLALAIWQQVTTYFGIAALAIWVFACVVQWVFFNPAAHLAWKRVFAAGVVAVAVLALVVITQTDMMEWAVKTYGRASLFNADRQDEFWFYFVRYFVFYPTLWSLIGLLAVFAVVHSPRLAWLAVCVFGISFLLVSFAGSKAMRYFSFAQPFLAIVWGVGMAYALVPLSAFAEAARVRLAATFTLPQRIGSRIATSLMVLAFAIVLIMNPFWLRTATLIGDVALPYDNPVTDWSAAKERLGPLVKDVDIMITTEELGAIYYLGRSDVRFSPSKIRELAPDQRKEFGIDHRTGRPIITTPESLERLIECFPRGLVVGPIEHWGSPILISKTVQAVIRKYARPFDVPEKSHLYAWSWERNLDGMRPEYCSDVDQVFR